MPYQSVNTTYKILVKILCNCLTDILPNIIDKNQGGFVKGHDTTDNAIILMKILDSMFKQDPRLGFETKHMAFNLDMQKTYDHVSRVFLKLCCVSLSFLKCLSKSLWSVSIQLLLRSLWMLTCQPSFDPWGAYVKNTLCFISFSSFAFWASRDWSISITPKRYGKVFRWVHRLWI